MAPTYPHCMFMGIFPIAQGQLTPHSVVGSGRNSNSVGTLRACKNEEDPIKNESARVAIRLYVNFSDVQWQIWWDLVEIRTHSSIYACPNYLQE